MTEPQWEACKICGGDHWTTHHGHDPRAHQSEPTTAAGRALLANTAWTEDVLRVDAPYRDDVLAIEAEARAAALEQARAAVERCQIYIEWQRGETPLAAIDALRGDRP